MSLKELEPKFKSIREQKRLWNPRQFQPDEIKSDRDSVLKVLAIGLALELPVGEFISRASKSDLPGLGEHGKALLERNVLDEDVHFDAISKAVVAFPVPQQYKDEAELIAKNWLAHPDHTLLKAAVLELGVFFPALAILRKSGSVPLKVMSNDISRDEASHVNSNWTVADSLGYTVTPSLNSLRRATVAWIVGSNASQWLETSDRLISTRKAPELSFTAPAVATAFFEIDRSAISGYGRY